MGGGLIHNYFWSDPTVTAAAWSHTRPTQQWKGEKWGHKNNLGVSINMYDINSRGLNNLQRVCNVLLAVPRE